jgi:hypothetical protein
MPKSPNKDCPGCAGAGLEPNYWDIQQGRAKEGDKVPCELCDAGFREIYEAAGKMIESYTGKQSTTIPLEVQNDIITGEEGQRYRRLLNWLWTHPEEENQDKNGLPRNSKTYKTKSFSQLFDFERVPRKPRIRPHEGMTVSVTPYFLANVKELRGAWTAASKAVRVSNIPILEYIAVDVHLNHLEFSGTNLEEWSWGECPALSFTNNLRFLLPAKLVGRILRNCNQKGDIAVGLNRNGTGYMIQHETMIWAVPLMPENAYPVQTWTEVRTEQEVA